MFRFPVLAQGLSETERTNLWYNFRGTHIGMRSWLESTKSPYDDCGYCQRQAQLRFGKDKLADSSAAQWEDIEVLDHLDDILAAFCSGPQDISQSRGLPGQPNHARIKEFEAEVAGRVHAAGR